MKKRAERGNGAIYWCFTINNPPTLLLDYFGPIVVDFKFREKVVFMSYQLEKGEAGTPHLQGYIVLKEKSRFSAIKKLSPLFEKAHFEVCKGGVKDNVAYTTKEEGRLFGPWIFGWFDLISDLYESNDLE